MNCPKNTTCNDLEVRIKLTFPPKIVHSLSMKSKVQHCFIPLISPSVFLAPVTLFLPLLQTHPSLLIGDIRHIIEIDCRPSDSIILALMHNAPIFCTKEVLEKTVPLEE